MLTSLAFSFVLLFRVVPASGAPEPEPFGRLAAPATTQVQSLETVLQSIEERLRSLDNVYSLRFAAPRWELSVETQTRKLEALESKLSRIETLLELRIDKITEGLNSKTLKEELVKDQLSRKIDTIYERLNHRMSYMESRIENNIAKMQALMSDMLNRMNQQLEHVDKNINVIEADVVEVTTGVEEVKAALGKLNGTLVSDGSSKEGVIVRDLVDKLQDQQTDMMTKVELNVELVRKSMELSNGTQREFQQGLQALKTYKDKACQMMPDDTFDILLTKVDSLQRKNDGNYYKLDYTINRLIEKQDMFQESCLRIQQDEPQIEDRIQTILEKYLFIIDDRSNSTDRNYENLMEGLKNHHKHMLLNVSQVTNHVVRVSQQITEEFKSFYNEMVLNNPTADKVDSIISNLQDLQESFIEINATLNSSGSMNQNQQIANTTKTILELIQSLNENINVIIDKLSDYYKIYPDSSDTEDETTSKASKKILNIFNMTEEDLTRVKQAATILRDDMNKTSTDEQQNENNSN